MALADPQSITIGSAVSLPRISIEGYESVYQAADRTVTEQVKHTVGAKRTRSLFRVDKTVIAADPLTSLNGSYVGSVYLVMDFPQVGFTTTDRINIATGLFTQLTASSNAVLTKLIGLES
jgi:hypothetical protein